MELETEDAIPKSQPVEFFVRFAIYMMQVCMFICFLSLCRGNDLWKPTKSAREMCNVVLLGIDRDWPWTDLLRSFCGMEYEVMVIFFTLYIEPTSTRILFQSSLGQLYVRNHWYIYEIRKAVMKVVPTTTREATPA